jgi:hypothetical protein
VLAGLRDPAPAECSGTGGMTSLHRALGSATEDELRLVPGLEWWYDPDLPLRLVAGAGTWTSDGRGLETPEEFAKLVADYTTELRAGAVFPPLLVAAIDPAADRDALGSAMYRDSTPEGWQLDYPHYRLLNGRHRVTAAVAVPLGTFPALVVRGGAGFAAVLMKEGPWCLGAAGRAARERGRRGLTAAAAAGRTLRRVS